MAWNRKDTRRADRRALKPTLDDKLETRVVLSTFSAFSHVHTLAHPTREPVPNQILTAAGGRKVRIGMTNGEYFDASLTNGGTIRARRLPGGRVALNVRGSTVQSELVIEPVAKPARPGLAHQFAPNYGNFTHVLNVGAINIQSGTIGKILGYRTVDLSGPVTIDNDPNTPIDRIAFYNLLPGASITTGSDLNTLDIYNDADLSGVGTGINIGRDLNWFYSTGNLNVSDGATFTVGRDVGLTAQASKGTDPGGQGALIVGNVTVDPSSTFVIGRNLAAPFRVDGNFTGVDQVTVGGTVTGSAGFVVLGTQTP